jgi:hypothetical protein
MNLVIQPALGDVAAERGRAFTAESGQTTPSVCRF